MAVDITAQSAFSPGKPRLLFEGRYWQSSNLGAQYDVTNDGQQFVMISQGDQQSAVTQLIVVQNWFEELKERVPVP